MALPFLDNPVKAEQLDPFAEDFLADPYPGHALLREAGPVVHLERYGIWAMARYQQVYDSLRDADTFCSSAGVGISNFHQEEPWRTPSLLLEADPPAHTGVRAVVNRVLSKRALEVLRSSFERKAEAVVESALAKGSIDGFTDLGRLFPMRVFPDAVGIKDPDRSMLLPYGEMAFNAFGPHNALFEKSMENAAEVSAWIGTQCQRESLTDDGLGAQIHAAAEAGEITPEQAPLLVRSLLTAGVDTTVHGLGHALHNLARNPGQWQLLREDPTLGCAALDEAVRLESPVQTFFRTTTREVQVEGTTIPQDQKVLLFLAAANRDPDRWEEPERYDIQRDTRGHVGFGAGIHMCVGQMLARLEADVLFTVLAGKVSTLELAAEPTIRLNNTLRGYASIPLRITPN